MWGWNLGGRDRLRNGCCQLIHRRFEVLLNQGCAEHLLQIGFLIALSLDFLLFSLPVVKGGCLLALQEGHEEHGENQRSDQGQLRNQQSV